MMVQQQQLPLSNSQNDKEMVLNKLRMNTKCIKKILDEMEEAYKKISTVKLKK